MKIEKPRRALILAGSFLALIILCSALMCASARRALVLGPDGKYFRARVVWAGAGIFLALRADTLFDDRAKALEAKEEKLRPSFMPLGGISTIEFLPDPAPMESDEDSPAGEAVNYFGQFTVNAAGNQGVLVIWQKDGVAYGSIRFPGWGRGAVEPLKGLALSGKSIRFVRSANSPEELRYVGGSAYFIQEYFGEYRPGGNEIVGFYMVQGQRKQWEAYRAR